jgi:tRNA nucleotidyltransferase (CCA-adding enzyme)
VQTYLVGGAVRDALMGLRVQDRDWMVVGASPQQMLDQGFMAVGQDFPVFLHPTTHEEYALARTERKTAPGYKGFAVHAAPDVTLEEDLGRRDLTINSIAVSADCVRADGTFDAINVVDPFRGSRDIEAKVLRHTTAAFAEDPVRILRLARFAARFSDFSVDAQTMALMQSMVAAGEADHLVAERVWQELARGLMERQPSRLFAVLSGCGALERLLPELDTSARAMAVLDGAASIAAPLAVRFAVLCMHGPGAGQLLGVCQRLRVPTECAALAQVVAREHHAIAQAASMDAAGRVQLLERCDAFRKPERLTDILQACACDAAQGGAQPASHAPSLALAAALQLAQTVATDSVAAQAIRSGATGPKIGEAIYAARVTAVALGML